MRLFPSISMKIARINVRMYILNIYNFLLLFPFNKHTFQKEQLDVLHQAIQDWRACKHRRYPYQSK